MNCSGVTSPVSVSCDKTLKNPLLKSAMQSGLSTRPSPGLDREMGGEKETVLLLQSSSWRREGSKRGVSSSSIPQSQQKTRTRRDSQVEFPDWDNLKRRPTSYVWGFGTWLGWTAWVCLAALPTCMSPTVWRGTHSGSKGRSPMTSISLYKYTSQLECH